MESCPQCGTSAPPSSSPDRDDVCPGCGRIAADVDRAAWVDVARVANLAEAGFICDELVGLGFEAHVRQVEELNVASHRPWSQHFIRVRSDQSADAARHVRQYLNSEGDAEPTVLGRLRRIAGTPAEPVSWGPIFLVVLAGLASFALGQRLSPGRGDDRLPQNSLASRIGEIDRSFSTEPAANQPRYRLSYDRKRQAWTLATDRDNDGQFESVSQFKANGVAR